MEAIYKIYDLKKYYPDFIRANPIAVVSDLTEEELLLRCPELRAKAPFVYFSRIQWKGFRKGRGHTGWCKADRRDWQNKHYVRKLRPERRC